MSFESSIRQFLGDKAYGIAGGVYTESYFRKWIRKCIPVMKKRVENLETTTRHKEMLMSNVEELNESLKIKNGGSEKDVIVNLFWIISRLLGFDGVSGKVFNEPLYFQSFGQYLREEGFFNNKNLFDLEKEERRNIITARKSLVGSLKKRGFSDVKIAEILNTGEKQIKKLKHNI